MSREDNTNMNENEQHVHDDEYSQNMETHSQATTLSQDRYYHLIYEHK